MRHGGRCLPQPWRARAAASIAKLLVEMPDKSCMSANQGEIEPAALAKMPARTFAHDIKAASKT
jgi:hypothetical protein